jgi:hypothetical protein
VGRLGRQRALVGEPAVEGGEVERVGIVGGVRGHDRTDPASVAAAVAVVTSCAPG